MRCPACSAEVHLGEALCGACGWDLKKIYTGPSPDAETRLARRQERRQESAPRRLPRSSVASSPHGSVATPPQGTGATPPRGTVAAGRHARVLIDTELGARLDLDRCDALFLERYDLGSLEPAFLHQPTVLCETLEEFSEVLVEDLRLSSTQREGLRASLCGDEGSESEGILGVYLPGRGCFLNGSALQRHGGACGLEELFTEPRARVMAARTAVHEKLGHGFLAETTAVGAERRANGLERLRLAQSFGLETADSPTHEILTRKHALIFQATVFVDEGFSRWLETDLLGSLGLEPRVGIGPAVVASSGPSAGPSAESSAGPSTEPSTEPSTGAPAGQGDSRRLASIDGRSLQGIDERLDAFLSWALDPPEAFDEARADAVAATGFLAAVEDDDELAAAVTFASGAPPRYSLGAVLMEAIARRHRHELVPAAALIAYNVKMGIDELAVADLRELLADPRFHMTARACQLVALPPCTTAAELAETARELLAFVPPACFAG